MTLELSFFERLASNIDEEYASSAEVTALAEQLNILLVLLLVLNLKEHHLVGSDLVEDLLSCPLTDQCE